MAGLEKYKSYADEVVKSREEAKFKEKALVQQQLNERGGLCVQACGSVRHRSDCHLCSYCDTCEGDNGHSFLFRGSIIPNRRNPHDPFVFSETWKSEDTLKCDSFKEGCYAILCVKPGCKYTGVVYFGESKDIHSRCRDHKKHIIGVDNKNVKRMHRHFIEHGDSCPLQYFRFVPIKEVKGGPTARQAYENEMMERFGTRGYFGFNDRQARLEENSPPPPPKVAKVDKEGDEMYAWKKPSAHGGSVSAKPVMEPRVLLSLALLNHPNSTPPHSATTAEITNFANAYFKMNTITKSMFSAMRQRVNSSNKEACPPMEVDWLVWINRPLQPLPSGRKNTYTYGIKPGFQETIDQEIKTEFDSGELHKLVKDGVSVKLMIKGLLPLAPKTRL
ncbi:uncharacterized protein LOC110849151 [Folsomia candida]|uniref:uncharacterized protein LOC110849151 n=1 Tax=Folsomia candida TaxID=158441 RepID=UPI000B8F73B3|nr:uncharacterized protein LOC110849151 [Folsomia candida]